MAGGKRLRPVLVVLAAEAVGGLEIDAAGMLSDEADGFVVGAALSAAAAIEMIHTYSLIHDDLPAMDDDDLRRGQPTCHRQFDEATAILAGDGLLTLAFETLAGIRSAAVAAVCCRELAIAAGKEGMVGGQMADVAAERQQVPENEALAVLEGIHRRKTGRLLTAALMLGGHVAEASPQALQRLQSYGECVGMAFQITDDLLDVVGEVDKMGKQVRKDAGHGKLTFPALVGEAESRSRAAALVDEACQAVETFGDRGRRLQALARYVIERDR